MNRHGDHRVAWSLLLALTSACSRSAGGAFEGGTDRGGGGAGNDGPADASPADATSTSDGPADVAPTETARAEGGAEGGGDGSSLVSSAVCGGEPRECPPQPTPDAPCTKALLCCVYELGSQRLAGCICYMGRWICANQICGCTGGLPPACSCPSPPPSNIKVCGSDGRTHDSACQARCAGARVVDGCACGRPDGAVCGCNDSTDLVCGTDGQTWTNACLATSSGVAVASVGACGTGAPRGTLPEGSACQARHDLCADGLKCCLPPRGVPADAGAAPVCLRAMGPDQCPRAP